MDINGDWRQCCFNDRRAGTLSLPELLTSGNFPKQCMAALQTGGIDDSTKTRFAKTSIRQTLILQNPDFTKPRFGETMI